MDEPTTDLDPEGREGYLLSAAVCGMKDGPLSSWTRIWKRPRKRINSGSCGKGGWQPGKARGGPGRYPALQACGVKVPALVELFTEMGWPGRPLRVEEAFTLIEKHNLAIRKKFQPTNLHRCRRAARFCRQRTWPTRTRATGSGPVRHQPGNPGG